MASTKIDEKNDGGELKHLGFVRLITINAVVCVSSLYGYAKLNSGSLKSTVETVESAVTAVVGPVYDKFKAVPGDLLVFLDNKVDEATIKFNCHAPTLAKQVVGQAESLVKKASLIAQNIAHEGQVGGPRAAIHHAATLYKQTVLSQAAKIWYGINKVPVINTVTQIAVPAAANVSTKYNKSVKDLAAKGYTIFVHFPLVPIDEMAKAYKEVETAKEGGADACDEPKKEVD